MSDAVRTRQNTRRASVLIVGLGAIIAMLVSSVSQSLVSGQENSVVKEGPATINESEMQVAVEAVSEVLTKEFNFISTIASIVGWLCVAFFFAGFLFVMVLGTRTLRRANKTFNDRSSQTDEAFQRQAKSIEIMSRSLQVNEEVLAVQREISQQLQKLLEERRSQE